jgi:hypothetical protein
MPPRVERSGSHDDDGLSDENRILFGQYVRWVMGPKAPQDRIARDLRISPTRFSSLLNGETPFRTDQLKQISISLLRIRSHRIHSVDNPDQHLVEVQRALGGDVSGEVAATLRRRIGGVGTQEPTDEDLWGTVMAGEGDAPSRIFGILSRPELGKVALPALGFGLVVGIPYLTKVKSAADSTGLDALVLLGFGLALWVAANVMALDKLMRWIILRVVRRLPFVSDAYASLDFTIARRLKLLVERPGLRRLGGSMLALKDDRRSYRFNLNWAETCERVAVWSPLAGLLTFPLALAHQRLWLLYPLCLLLLGPPLFLSAVIDRVRLVRNMYRTAPLR